MSEATAFMHRAQVLLQQQQALIDGLTEEVVRLRLERDEARQVHALLEAILDRLPTAPHDD